MLIHSSRSLLLFSSTTQPVSLTDNKDALVLRLKYHRTTLFLTCQPTTPLSTLKADFLNAVKAINQPALSSLPQYIQADGKDYPDWGEMDAFEDIGLFVAGSTGSDALERMTVYMPLDQDATQSNITVRKAGLKDADAVCVGFRAKGSCKSLLGLASKHAPRTFLLTDRCFPSSH